MTATKLIALVIAIRGIKMPLPPSIRHEKEKFRQKQEKANQCQNNDDGKNKRLR